MNIKKRFLTLMCDLISSGIPFGISGGIPGLLGMESENIKLN